MNRKRILFALIAVLLTLGLVSACSMEVSKIEDTLAVPTDPLVTATLYPTFTPRATATFLPSTAMPTIEPVTGKATAQINVRERASTSSPSLGMLSINSEVQIIGRDEGANWYQIIFTNTAGESQRGWAAAEYILGNSSVDIPVTTSENEDVNGLVSERVNVRSGPGTEFDALGMLDANEGIVITGTNLDAMWLQIEYASGPENRGWIYALYVENNAEDLPIVDESGGEVTIATQTSIAATAAPIYSPAPEDDDTMEEPAIFVTFSTSDSRAFSYSSDVSAPEGDFEDWISFHPNSDELRVDLLIDLTCSGNGTLYIELLQGGVILNGDWEELKCGDTNYPINLYRDETYQFRLYSKYSNKLLYTSYTLEMRVAP